MQNTLVSDELPPTLGLSDTDCASSHVTIGERPILYIRVKKASAVKIIGAIKNSYSSNTERIEDLAYDQY